MPSSNKYKKFSNATEGNGPSLEHLENKMASLYKKKFQKQSNWAQEGSTIEEKDVDDFLNEEVYYGGHNPTKKVIKFKVRTQ